jgi:hypothetical protein
MQGKNCQKQFLTSLATARSGAAMNGGQQKKLREIKPALVLGATRCNQ